MPLIDSRTKHDSRIPSRAARLLVLLFVTAVGCGGSTDDGGAGGASGGCADWRAALCDFVGRCGGDETGCRDDAATIACDSQTVAAMCAAQLAEASCTSPPTGCDFSDIADRDVARDGCNDFIDAFCAADTRCGSTVPLTDCRAELMTTVLDCNFAIGVASSLDQCLQDLETWPCDATTGPESCSGTIRVSQ